LTKEMKKNIYFLISVVLLAGFFSCNNNAKKQTESIEFREEHGEIFHTTFHIKYQYDKSLYDEIMAELEKFDHSLNPFKPNSIISDVNNNKPVALDSFFVEVFNKAKQISKVTNGIFDITCSPLVNAWGFGFNNMDKVTPKTIDSLMQFVGYQKIRLKNGKIIKDDSRVQINTSAIAKGYSCDVIANLMKRHGIKNYMIEIGGEIAMSGKNDKGDCWRIGVDKAIDDSTAMHRELQTILSICDKCVATSGNYRNYYVKDGKKYAHTIDPTTGYPAEQDVLGVTILANDCMTADAFATAFMASGLAKSRDYVKKVPELEYYVIYRKHDGKLDVEYSKGFEKYFVEGDPELKK